MTDSDRAIIHARLAHWPGQRYACAWPTDPELAHMRVYLLDGNGDVEMILHRYEAGRGWPAPRGT